MKRYLIRGITACLCLALVAWGAAGHRTVAAVAEKHLLPNVSRVVSVFLGSEKMTDVASWADEVRNQTEYKNTAPWHFVNLPLGLGHDEFVNYVKGLSNDNIYTAILKSEATLEDNLASVKARQDALKFLIHLVGDAHQPMHISRKEDKGGNTIQVRFDGKGTNLHSLWDGKLIDHEHLSDAEMLAVCDKATPGEIKQWQSDSPMQWLWESYQLSSQLYKDVEANKKIDEAYYVKWIPVIHKRINQAGIRLASELNRILKNQRVEITNVVLSPPPPVSQSANSSAVQVELKDLPNMISKEVVTQGKVYGMKDVGSMVLVNVGAAYPNQLLTIVLKGDAKQLASQITDQTIAVTGTVFNFKGKPEIVITEVNKLTILNN
jgi:hypothetical protein